jgi:predicted transcriptional regulator
MKFPNSSDIRLLRKALDMTQSELAALSGVSQSTIAKIERGSISASYDMVVALFNTLEEVTRSMQQGRSALEFSSREVVSVQAEESVRKASELMRRSGYSQLPVLDGQSPVGSISEKGILRLLSTGISMDELGKKRVSEVMEEMFPMVTESTPMDVVATLVSVSNAVLVANQGRITGVITSSDVLKLL